jgi:hypothetical protein
MHRSEKLYPDPHFKVMRIRNPDKTRIKKYQAIFVTRNLALFSLFSISQTDILSLFARSEQSPVMIGSVDADSEKVLFN